MDADPPNERLSLGPESELVGGDEQREAFASHLVLEHHSTGRGGRRRLTESHGACEARECDQQAAHKAHDPSLYADEGLGRVREAGLPRCGAALPAASGRLGGGSLV